jgi:hypothetical protein
VTPAAAAQALWLAVADLQRALGPQPEKVQSAADTIVYYAAELLRELGGKP